MPGSWGCRAEAGVGLGGVAGTLRAVRVVVVVVARRVGRGDLLSGSGVRAGSAGAGAWLRRPHGGRGG